MKGFRILILVSILLFNYNCIKESKKKNNTNLNTNNSIDINVTKIDNTSIETPTLTIFNFQNPDFKLKSLKPFNLTAQKLKLKKLLENKGNTLKFSDDEYISDGKLGSGEGGNGIVYRLIDKKNKKKHVAKLFKFRSKKIKKYQNTDEYNTLVNQGKIHSNNKNSIEMNTDKWRAKREFITHTKLMKIIPEYSVLATIFIFNGVFLIKKRFIEGLTLKTTIESKKFDIEKQNALKKLFSVLAKTKYSFKSLNPANIIFETNTRKWIIIDAGNFTLHKTTKEAYGQIIKNFKKDLFIHKKGFQRTITEKFIDKTQKQNRGLYFIDTKNLSDTEYKELWEFKKSL